MPNYHDYADLFEVTEYAIKCIFEYIIRGKTQGVVGAGVQDTLTLEYNKWL